MDTQLIAEAIRSISHGDVHGPTGLESLTMAIGGQGMPGNNNVASALSDIAIALQEIADAIRATK